MIPHPVTYCRHRIERQTVYQNHSFYLFKPQIYLNMLMDIITTITQSTGEPSYYGTIVVKLRPFTQLCQEYAYTVALFSHIPWLQKSCPSASHREGPNRSPDSCRDFFALKSPTVVDLCVGEPCNQRETLEHIIHVIILIGSLWFHTTNENALKNVVRFIILYLSLYHVQNTVSFRKW